MARGRPRTRKHTLDAVKSRCPPPAVPHRSHKGGTHVCELDTRHDARYTRSLEFERVRVLRARRERRRSVPASLQVRAVSANDLGVATRSFQPDAPATGPGAGSGPA